jgi:hypothetical protein
VFGSSRIDATSEETEDIREHYAAEDFAYPPDTRGEHSHLCYLFVFALLLSIILAELSML